MQIGGTPRKMGRVVPVIVFRVVVGVFFSLVIAAQVAALWYRYSPQLGTPLFGVLYMPWDFVSWFWRWHELDATLDVIAMLSLLGAVAMAWHKERDKDKIENAKEWGGIGELRSAGLVSRSYPGELGGIILGETENGRLISFSDPRHVIVSGPVGSGKTVVNVIPTVLSYGGSVVVLDPKGKLFEVTGAHRQGIGDAFYWDASDDDTCSFNPFDEIDKRSSSAISDVQRLVGLWVGGSMVDDQRVKHWREQCETLISAMALYLIYDSVSDATFSNIRVLRGAGDKAIRLMSSSKISFVRDAASAFGGYPNPTQQAILSGVDNALSLFGDPRVAMATSRSDFRISDLMCGEKPLALYLQCRPNDADRLAPWLALMLSQIVSTLTASVSKTPDGMDKVRTCLLVLEEAAFGCYQQIMRSLLIMRECGLHALIVTQTMEALHAAYGRTAVDGLCAIKIGSASADRKEQEYFCGDVGQRLEQTERVTRKRHGWFTRFDETVSVSSHKSPLMTYQQFRGLPKNRAVMIVEGCEKAFVIHKRPWWQSTTFAALGRNVRIGDATSSQSAKILAAHAGSNSRKTADVSLSDTVLEIKLSHDQSMPQGGFEAQSSAQKPETPLATLARLRGWDAETVQREFFNGEVALRTVKQWITGSKLNIPRERLRKIREELARARTS